MRTVVTVPRAAGSTRSEVWLRLLVAAAVASLLVYVALLAVYSGTSYPTSMVSASHWPALMDKPVGEDAYYMLTVAQNIATRGRILYNGDLPATGIQPLATLLFAALDWVVTATGGDAEALIRSVLLTGVALFILFAWQIGRIAAMLSPPEAKRYAATLASLLTLCSYTLFRLFTYGLETGVYLLLLAACFIVTLQIAAEQRTSTWNAVLLGVAAGLAGEARIDFGLPFAIVLLFLLAYRWISWGKALLTGSIALLLVSPWFLFVHRVSGSWLPSSGKAESTLIAWQTTPWRLLSMALAIAGQVMPWCYAVVSRATIAAAVVSTALLLWLFLRRKGQRQLLGRLLLSQHGRMWCTALLSLLPVYLLLFNARHFYYRYTAPLAVLAVPVCAIAFAHSGWVRRHMVLAALGMVAAFAAWDAGSLHTGRVGNSQTIAAGYIHRYFPQARVGAFQSGVVGFFNPNVENLDGKLNAGALAATAANRLPQFIDAQHIAVLVDWPSVIHANLPQTYLDREWQPCPVPIVGGAESICLVRRAVSR